MSVSRDHFRQQMHRLTEVFPQAYKSTDRLALIWREVSRLSDNQFTRVVDELVGSCRQPPLVKEFREMALQELERTGFGGIYKPVDLDRPADCDDCSDLGVFLCSKRPEGGIWAFRCHCEKGVNNPRREIPHFVKWHQDNGWFWIDPAVAKQISVGRMPA